MSHATRNAPTARVIAALAGIAVVVGGCSNAAEKLAEKGIEEAIENESGGEVDIDFDDGGFTFESDEGSVRVGEDGSFIVEGDDGEVITGSADDESFTIEGGDGENSFSSGPGIPDEWPGDVPRPMGLSDVNGTVQQSPDFLNITVVGMPPGSAADYAQEYAAMLEGIGYERMSFFESDGITNIQYENPMWAVSLFANDNAPATVTVGVSNPLG